MGLPLALQNYLAKPLVMIWVDLILDSTLSWSTTLFVCLRYVLYY